MQKSIVVWLFATLSIAVSLFGIVQAKTTATSSSVQSNKQQSEPKLSAKYQALADKLKQTIQVTVIEVTPLAVNGMVEVVTDQGLFYTTENGDYLFHGQLFSLKQGIQNLTEASLAKVRVNGIKRFENDMIVFKAKDEKYAINVFTDITCGYCRKLHSHIKEFNDKGITVRYLAYPRAGIKDRTGDFTQNFKDMRSVWCADDPQQAMTTAKLGSNIPYRICDKPIADEFNFGRQIGVNGTPAIVLSNGYMIPGYQTPDQLLQVLNAMPNL